VTSASGVTRFAYLIISNVLERVSHWPCSSAFREDGNHLQWIKANFLYRIHWTNVSTTPAYRLTHGGGGVSAATHAVPGSLRLDGAAEATVVRHGEPGTAGTRSHGDPKLRPRYSPAVRWLLVTPFGDTARLDALSGALESK